MTRDVSKVGSVTYISRAAVDDVVALDGAVIA